MKKRTLVLTVCILITYCLVCNFNTIKSAITETMSIWLSVVVPSVFPYVTLTKYLSGTGALKMFEIFPGNLLCRLFNISQCSISAVICSLFCGYPSGAICARDLYTNGNITFNEAKHLIKFTNNAGPLFVVSAVGSTLMGSAKKGLAVYIIHITSAIIYGIFTSYGNKPHKITNKKSLLLSHDLCSCIKAGVETTINICGYMVAASVLARCTQIFMMNIVTSDKAIKLCTLFTNALFEISSGVTTAALSGLSKIKFPLICAIVSWSGLSVIMQIKSVGENIISFSDIIKAKLIQSAISFLLGYAFNSFQNRMVIRNQTTNAGIKISLMLSLILYIYYIMSKKKDTKV